MIRFRSFQTRIAFFFLALVSLVQSGVFLTVDAINTRQAREQIERALAVGAGNFRSVTELRSQQLVEAVRILSSDFAFKTAFITGDRATVHSALANQGGRVGADVMILVSLDHRVMDDTRPASGVYPPGLGELVRDAERNGQASSLLVLDGKAYQLVVQPVLGPDPIAWLVAGFALDDALARSMQQLLKLDVSFYQARAGNVVLLASSLEGDERAALSQVAMSRLPEERVAPLVIEGSEVLNFATRVGSQDSSVHVLLQRSVAEELKPFEKSRNIVLLLSLAGLALSLAGAFFIARTVTRPVRALVEAVQGAEQGDYSRTVKVEQHDEIGVLATAFNRMLKGLAERDRVRDLFGKFVSRAVAERALAGEAVLGGEDRVVTVLFSDLRNFTSFSERRSPQEVLARLNRYFSVMSEIVERNDGVVDKYLGDGIMALFGAPVASEDDAGNALQTALEMCAALEKLNREFAAEGLPRVDLGIGVNTGTAVAGNMGSPNRLNYSVIGDCVNLAARIEGLTKRREFGARIIVTDATIRASRRRFEARELGLVNVRGRSEPVALHALVEPAGNADERAAARQAELHPG